MLDFHGVLLILFFALIIYFVRGIGVPDAAQKGGQDTTRSLNENQLVYARQYKELDNFQNVLHRSVDAADETTNNLVGFTSDMSTDSQPALLKEPTEHYLDLTADPYPVPPKPSADLKKRVKERQPYFMGKPYVKDYYGKQYYADWRYPLFLVSTEFAENPAKFIHEHPKEYPSYVINSRTPHPWGGVKTPPAPPLGAL